MKDDRDLALDMLAGKLDQQEIDADSRIRLRRARAVAISRARERRDFGVLVPFGTFATAFAVALAFALQTQAPLEPPALSSDFNEALFVYSPIDTHIAEELYFYAWLERRGNAG